MAGARAVVPNEAERRVLEGLLATYSLEGVLLALSWIYSDRAQRFGGSASEAIARAKEVVDDTAELARAASEAFEVLHGLLLDSAELAGRAGL